MPGLKIGSALNELGQKFFASDDLIVKQEELLWRESPVFTQDTFTVSDEIGGNGTKESPFTWKGFKAQKSDETSISENLKTLKAGTNISFYTSNGTLTISAVGSVKSVNGQQPDNNGNVQITIPELGDYMKEADYTGDGDQSVNHANVADNIGENTAEQVTDAVSKAHSHANSEVLGKLGESEGSLTFDGKPITSAGGSTGGGVADSVDWNNVTGKPDKFPPEEHDHVLEDITDLAVVTETTPGLMSPEDKAKLDSIVVGENGGTMEAVKWEEIQGKPSVFPPQDHIHDITEVENLQATLDTFGKVKTVNGIAPDDSGNITISIETDIPFSVTWDSVKNKPETFPPDEHTHELKDIEGLEEALDSKLSSANGNVAVPSLMFTCPKSEEALHLEVMFKPSDSEDGYKKLVDTSDEADRPKVSGNLGNETWIPCPAEGFGSLFAGFPVMVEVKDIEGFDPSKMNYIRYRWVTVKDKIASDWYAMVYPVATEAPWPSPDPVTAISVPPLMFTCIASDNALHLEIKYKEVGSQTDYVTLVNTSKGTNRDKVFAYPGDKDWIPCPEEGLGSNFAGWPVMVKMDEISGFDPTKLYFIRYRWIITVLENGVEQEVPSDWYAMMYPVATESAPLSNTGISYLMPEESELEENTLLLYSGGRYIPLSLAELKKKLEKIEPSQGGTVL